MASWLPAALAMVCMPGGADLLDLDDTDEEVDTELLSLLNPWSGEGEGVRVSAAHGSHHIWPQSQLHCGTCLWSWCDIQWVCLGSSTHLSVFWSPSSCRGPSWLQSLHDSIAGRWEQGHPDPLALAHHSVMACTINCQPSCKLNALALSWAAWQPNWWFLIVWTWHHMPCPSQVHLLEIAFHKTRWPGLDWSLLLLWGQICHLRAFLPSLVLARHVGVEV